MDTLLVLSLIGLLVGAFLGLFLVDWLRALRRTGRARRNREGIQEIDVVVERGYHPEVVVVEAGSPVRISFVRAENLPCSRRVIFGGLGVERRLPAHATTPVEFTPTQPGEYMFTCDLGMYQGWLRVEPAKRRQTRRPVSGHELEGSQSHEQSQGRVARAMTHPARPAMGGGSGG